MFFGHLSFKLYSLVQSLHFSTHASSKQNSQRQNMVNFYSIKHRKFNLHFFCCSVYMQKLIHKNLYQICMTRDSDSSPTWLSHFYSDSDSDWLEPPCTMTRTQTLEAKTILKLSNDYLMWRNSLEIILKCLNNNFNKNSLYTSYNRNGAESVKSNVCGLDLI